jgi:DNA-binding CsgD family transcriptional regulator
MPDGPLIGRSSELAQLRALIDSAGGGALAILGDVGIGKSALLADLAGCARARGLCVLSATGKQGESSLAFAGLRQLLRPLLAELLAQPGRDAERLRASLGLAPRDPDTDQFPAGALLDLVTGRANGVLMLVDDAQWMDSATLDVLAFAARRLGGKPVTMICAARGAVPSAGLEHCVQELRLGPLSVADASKLLASLPDPPRGRARAMVLAQAAGNPLALSDLAGAIAADPAAGRSWGLLPLTDRLSAVFAAQLGALPAETRHALLLVAAADGEAPVPALDVSTLAPAEELGLVTVDTAGVRIRHPLLRSAVYCGAPFTSRAAAHRQLAEALPGRPDRRAWHLAATVLQPDERIASLLAATSSAARQRDGSAAMADALERAADLSPEPAEQARRLVSAAEAAVSAGQADWAWDLATRATGLTRDRDLRSRGERISGQALAWSGRYRSAAQVLLPLAREAAAPDPAAAWGSLGLAATAAYLDGDPGVRRDLTDAATGLSPAGDDGIQAERVWVLAVAGRLAEAGALFRRLRGTVLGLNAGAAAWLLDQTTDAITLLQGAREAIDDPQARAASCGPLAALGWAYLDAGRWDDALELVGQLPPGTDTAPSAGIIIAATIEAARGNTSRARTLISEALAADLGHSRLVTARARHALGLAALADGDYATAFHHLRHLFAEDGTPYHFHASYLAAGDLALAAVRSGHRLEGRDLLKRISAGRTGSSPRLGQLLARADGILADPSTPSAYRTGFLGNTGALGDPVGEQWPFERAQLRLELGEWLRRRRRINEAKPALGAAMQAFRALRAQPWEHRTEVELRACGITVPGTLANPGALRDLTPQQQQIIRLAAEGLSNREIGQRLYLSPRTVASHLYRSFPKLGVADRHQLQGLIAQADRTGRTRA